MNPSEIIMLVCRNAIPPVDPLETIRCYNGGDSWNCSRLKTIMARKMHDLGMRTIDISRHLEQTWNATNHQIARSEKLKTNPKYQHLFHS